jgi:hypothetical protein
LKEFNFTKYFTYLLYDHKQVAIPGLGIFKLERQNALLKPGDTIILPPSYNIQFHEDKSLLLEDGFLKKLKIYYPRLNKQEYLEYAKELTQTLERDNKVLLNNIGELYISDGKLFFVEDKSATNLLTQHFPILNTKFFSKPASIISWLDMKLASLPHKFWSYILPMLLVSLLAFSLLYFEIPTNWIKKKVVIETPHPKTELPIGKDSVKNIQEKIDSLLGEYGQINIDSVNTDPNGESIKRCIIITGAYRSEMYKNLMIEKITNLGYKVFIQDVDGLIRVGLEFECTESNLPEMLEKIRNTIETNAWHLDEKEG